MNLSNITAYVNNLFTFSSWFITSNFSSKPIVSRQFFTCTALGDIQLCFSLTLVRKANAVQQEIKYATKISVAMHRLCQIALNQQLSHKFKKWCKYSSHVRAKLCKTRLACILHINMQYEISSNLTKISV